jgi:hypothetical protein
MLTGAMQSQRVGMVNQVGRECGFFCSASEQIDGETVIAAV